MSRNRTTHTTRRMAMCAVLCALSVVVLGLGTVIEVLDLTAAVMAAIVILPVLLCYGTRYALLTYAVTAVLAVILMPQSLAAWMYAGLMGFYPILKRRLDRLPRVLAWVVKLVLLGAVMVLYLLVLYVLVLGGEGSVTEALLLGFGEVGGSTVLAWVAVGLSVFVMVIFDFLIDRLLILYRLKWRRPVEKWMKP